MDTVGAILAIRRQRDLVGYIGMALSLSERAPSIYTRLSRAALMVMRFATVFSDRALVGR